MNITLQNALKSSAFAIAIAFSGASYATPGQSPAPVVTYNQNPVDGGMVFDADAKFFKEPAAGDFHAQGVALYQMTGNDSYAQQFYAYCFAPTVDTLTNAIYTATFNVFVKDSVKALFEMAYANTLTGVGTGQSTDAQIAFQLALWELQDGNSDLFSGDQYYTRGNDANVEAAQLLIDNIQGYQLKNMYSYTKFTGFEGAEQSQTMLGVSAVSAVPEVQTWTMMGMGLALVGVMGRRRRKDDDLGDEKFS